MATELQLLHGELIVYCIMAYTLRCFRKPTSRPQKLHAPSIDYYCQYRATQRCRDTGNIINNNNNNMLAYKAPVCQKTSEAPKILCESVPLARFRTVSSLTILGDIYIVISINKSISQCLIIVAEVTKTTKRSTYVLTTERGNGQF